MKPKFSHFLGFIVTLMTLVIFTATAQEGVPNNEIPDLNFLRPEINLEEKPLLYEEKSTTSGERSTQSKEQLNTAPKIIIKSKPADASKTPATKSEDDALSFNFLYYIIQKFKISDIVEQ
jgi:hypothetical protein